MDVQQCRSLPEDSLHVGVQLLDGYLPTLSDRAELRKQLQLIAGCCLKLAADHLGAKQLDAATLCNLTADTYVPAEVDEQMQLLLANVHVRLLLRCPTAYGLAQEMLVQASPCGAQGPTMRHLTCYFLNLALFRCGAHVSPLQVRRACQPSAWNDAHEGFRLFRNVHAPGGHRTNSSVCH